MAQQYRAHISNKHSPSQYVNIFFAMFVIDNDIAEGCLRIGDRLVLIAESKTESAAKTNGAQNSIEGGIVVLQIQVRCDCYKVRHDSIGPQDRD